MFDTSIKKLKKKGILTMKGELTIDYANEMRDALLDAISRFKNLEIAFSEVEAVDFTCLQLLCSAHKSVNTLKKTMVLSGELPGFLYKAVADTGFSRDIGCFPGKVDDCFWLTPKE